MAHEARMRKQPSRPEHAPHRAGEHEPVVVDCDRCSVRGTGCGDCVVTVLLGGPPYGVALDDDERQALDVLAEAGLVPPLRMVESVESRHVDPA
jgi:hypothetical protein